MSKGAPKTPARVWAFTWNNYTVLPTKLPEFGRYAILGKEIGKKGTPHIQGHVEFTRNVRYTHVQKWLGVECHVEKVKSIPAHRQYCKKDQNWTELGKAISGQGSRTDINNCKESIKQGMPLLDLFDKHTQVCFKYPRAVNTYIGLLTPPVRTQLDVMVFFGKPGRGKTRFAYKNWPNLYAIPLGKGVWFDGYNKEETVLIDDFKGQMPLNDLLRLLDLYPIRVQTKGGHVWFTPKRIIITSNQLINDWYNYDSRSDEEQALRRRISHFQDFNEPLWDGYFAAEPVREYGDYSDIFPEGATGALAKCLEL